MEELPLLIKNVKMIYFLFCGFVKAKLIKLTEMAGVMHEADHF